MILTTTYKSQQLKFGFRRNPNFQKIQVGIEKRNFRLQPPQSATILHIIDNFKWAWAVCSIRQTASGILLYNTGVDEKNSSELRLISQNCAKNPKIMVASFNLRHLQNMESIFPQNWFPKGEIQTASQKLKNRDHFVITKWSKNWVESCQSTN